MNECQILIKLLFVLSFIKCSLIINSQKGDIFSVFKSGIKNIRHSFHGLQNVKATDYKKAQHCTKPLHLKGEVSEEMSFLF